MTPFCSCSSVPLFIGFVEAGIPLGVTFSFLIASPMINEVAVVILVGILGWKLAALYVVAGLLVAWFGGIVMQTFRPERWVEDYVWKIRMGQAPEIEQDRSLKARHRYAVHEVKEIVDLMLVRVKEQLDSPGLDLVLTDDAKGFLGTKGYDPELGARPLRRSIQRLLEDPLSEKMLLGEFRAGSTILVGLDEESEELTFEAFETPDQPTVELAESE